MMSEADLKLARDRWTQGEDADKNQRKREREDIGFYEGETQWPDEIAALRKGAPASVSASGGAIPATPAKPCLTINKTKDPVRHVINEFLQADLSVSVIPTDDLEGDAVDDAEVELREGLIRRIQREPEAQDAVLWAVSRADIAGRGFCGVMLRDVPGPTMDQEIYYRRFYNQFSVILDPAHEQPDGSDAEWAFVGTDVPWHVYKAEYGELSDGSRNPIINASDSEWRAFGDEAPGWFTTEGETRTCRVVEYWYYNREVVNYVMLDDGSIVEATEVDSRVLKEIPAERKKRDIVKTVSFCKLDGRNSKTLYETEWPGPKIPIAKFVGEEMHPFDNERREEGMVRAARDSQRAFNYMISAAVELIGLAPKAPFIGYAGQFENFEAMWDAAMSGRAIGRLEARATTNETGSQILPLPQRQTAEPPIQAMAMMIREFDAAIKSTTGIPDPTLGNVDPNARSGKAIRAMLEQALRGTSNYMANGIRSMHYLGDIVNDLLEPVYHRKGRTVRTMNTVNQTQHVMLHQPFVTNPNGRAEAFDPMKHPGLEPKTLTLTKNGRTKTAIKVSKHFDTRRQEEAVHLAELIEAQPELITWFGDKFFETMDSPGHKELAERAKVMLAPPIQKMLASGKPEDPRIAQLQQQMEQMGAELQKQMADKGAKIESAQIKAQSDAQQNQSDNQTKFLIAQMQEFMESQRAAMDRETKLAVAELGAKVDRLGLFMEERARLGAQGHEAEQADTDRMHEAAMSGMEHAQTLQQGEQEHGQALEQNAQAAALAPQPEQAGA